MVTVAAAGVLATAILGCQSSPDGPRLEFRAQCVDERCPGPDDLEAIRRLTEQRLAAGATPATVTTTPDGLLVIDLPSSVDPEPVRRLVGQRGRLDLVPIPDDEAVPSTGMQVAFPALTSGDASVAIGADETGRRAINVTLGEASAAALRDHTRTHIGAFLAVTLDGVAVAVPTIAGEIPDGKIQISGAAVDGFDKELAEELVTLVEFGPLPFPLDEVGAGPGAGPSR
jgi:preprotein translocase subunit SecD